MFIRTENEIVNLMPTARWSRPSQLFGYLEEEEKVALMPLLGIPLYQYLCDEYERLIEEYGDITPTTIKQNGKARSNPELPYASVTEHLNAIQCGNLGGADDVAPWDWESQNLSKKDLQAVRLLRFCQQIEFYKMISHKAGLLTVSFNEGGGMNVVTADGYDPADDKRIERVVKDAFMSAGRATDSLLLFLEADAKGDRVFTDLWKEADAFYLHRDLLFQTARVLNEYLDIHSERMQYVSLVRDIRFCQNTYVKPRIGAKLLKAVVDYANGLETTEETASSPSGNSASSSGSSTSENANPCLDELLSLLRTALAFYVEARRVVITKDTEKLIRRDSMTDAQQAMAMACQYVEDNLDALGDYAVGSPIYKQVKAQEARAKAEAKNADAARQRQCKAACEQTHRKLFTGFPATHRNPPITIKSNGNY